MKNKLTFIYLLLFHFISLHVEAQDFDVTKYKLDTLLDFPSGMQFAQDHEGVLWLKYNTSEGGVSVNKLIKFVNDEWEKSTFDVCSSCLKDIKSGPNGMLFIAAGEMGVYKRQDDQWNQVLKEEALALEWTMTGEMVILNTEGIHFLQGDTLRPGNNDLSPDLENLSQVLVNLTDEVFVISSSRLFTYSDSMWREFSDLSAPMSMDVDAENRVWVTDNFGEIGYYREDIYSGQIYNNFGTNDLVVNRNDVLWYASSQLIRNENGVEFSIEAEELIDDALIIEHLFVDRNNEVWVGSTFRSGLAKVKYLGEFSHINEATDQYNVRIYPNPVLRSLYIETDDQENLPQLRIYTSDGRLMHQEAHISEGYANQITVDFELFPNGIYLVHVIIGEEYKVFKVLKH